MDDEVLEWLADSVASNLSARSADNSQALVDTELSHDVPGSPRAKDAEPGPTRLSSSYGELIPLAGGEPIRLTKDHLHIGRMVECDVKINAGNVSGVHCDLMLADGFWYARDLHSSNGTKVNGKRLALDESKRLEPGDILAVAKHEFQIRYQPRQLGATSF